MTRLTLTLPRLRRSFPLPKREGDLHQDALSVCEHVVVPEAKDAKSFALEVGGTAGVGLWRVLPTVDLDNELVTKAEEVGDIGADWALAAEPGFRKGFPERLPKLLLGVGGIAAQAAGALDRTRGCVVVALHTLTLPRLRRSFPLPLGEGVGR